MGKEIHWELCKKLKFIRTIKWYMHKAESVLENEMHKILWSFEIQTDHQIQAKKPDFWLTSVGWKVHRLTKVIAWNVTRWGLFFKLVSLSVDTLLPSVLLCLDLFDKKNHQQKIDVMLLTFSPMNFSANPRSGLGRVKVKEGEKLNTWTLPERRKSYGTG